MDACPPTTDQRERISHPPASALDLATIMRTVGEPLRLEIVRLLADDRPRACSDLSDALGLPGLDVLATTCACCARRA